MRPMPYGYADGWCYYDNYDFYVYQGYRHRYSQSDICNYELIDTRTNTVVEAFHNLQCKEGYDACAKKRDELIATGSSYDLKD